MKIQVEIVEQDKSKRLPWKKVRSISWNYDKLILCFEDNKEMTKFRKLLENTYPWLVT